jgi:uncharacterized HAD superfamily protein
VERTKNWVHHHFPKIADSEIHFVNHFTVDSKPKSEVCREYDITLMIDDSFENAEDLASAGITTILLEKPWNKNQSIIHPLVHRVKNW